jgi:hypothetical protein
MREEAGDWPQDTSCGRLAFTDQDLPCASSQSRLVWASQAGSTSHVVCVGPFQFMSCPLGATRMVRSFSAHQSTRNSCRRLAFNDDQQQINGHVHNPCEVFAWGTGLVAPNIGSQISGPGPECFPLALTAQQQDLPLLGECANHIKPRPRQSARGSLF